MYQMSIIPLVPRNRRCFPEPVSPTPILFQFQYGNDQRARDWCCSFYWWDQTLFFGSNWYRDWLISWTHICILCFTPLPTVTLIPAYKTDMT